MDSLISWEEYIEFPQTKINIKNNICYMFIIQKFEYILPILIRLYILMCMFYLCQYNIRKDIH